MNPDESTTCPHCETTYWLVCNTADLSQGNRPVYCPFCGEEIDEESE